MSTNFVNSESAKSSSPSVALPDSAVHVEVKKFAEVSQIEFQLWKQWQELPHLISPYFHPEFVRCVDQVRDDVFIGVINEGGETVGFLPYQSEDGVNAEPVGGAVNDCHGIIGPKSSEISQADVVKACGLSRFNFHAWNQADESLEKFSYGVEESFVADLSEGVEHFIGELRQQSNTVKRHPQKTRKMMRELGPLRLELDCRDPELLDRTIQGKREKYNRTGVVDFFGVPWTRNLMHEVHQTNREDFGGMLSVLYAGDTVVASHFGMRCRHLLHYWYPIYAPEYRRYSPGTQLFLEIVNQLPEMGIKFVDFGYGYDLYKTRLTNRRGKVIRGSVDFNRIRRTYNKTIDYFVVKLKASSVKEPVKKAVRTFNLYAGQPRV